ncbi:4'-phosphopantetheinyl transferase superfamily protein [Duganella sp. FT50W]|uniref:Enterobactin synthase component D n=1 Tax=Duganella lactea TaxID=2692173 RepID=A0A6L8MS65_9BURK|nr:4'-phosphopantetheinyl transferase superfamily protein [Duganella lactea]MYM84907.1 4'-phosphopantetheinyl transferase superfamily protein [Duganella lactea]
MNAVLAPVVPGLRGHEVLTWHIGGLSPTLQLIKFDTQQFCLDAFAEQNVALPTDVLRSVHKRQAEYFFGRYAARLALRKGGLSELEAGIGARGSPAWPAGVVGSITHNSDCAVATVLPSSECNGIGIDIEHLPSLEVQEALAQSVLDAHEFSLLLAHEMLLPRAVLFGIIFSAKESFYKAVSARVGRFFGFEAIRLIEIGDVFVRFVVVEPLCAHWRPGVTGTVYFRRLGQDVLTAFAW